MPSEGDGHGEYIDFEGVHFWGGPSGTWGLGPWAAARRRVAKLSTVRPQCRDRHGTEGAKPKAQR